MIVEIGNSCLLMRTRLILKVITNIYDEQFRSLEVSSAQFALLVAIYQLQPATRANIGRHQHLDRSTLTRNLKVILSEGWAEETREGADGRSRPIVLTMIGADILRKAEPAWRAAQVQVKDLLGKDAFIAVMDLASRIMDPLAPSDEAIWRKPDWPGRAGQTTSVHRDRPEVP
jgi:DNA-binding MarR family transcriptional regulator